MTKHELEQAALVKAESGSSMTNYPAIFEGFMAKGITPDDIRPRENVLTFKAWKAKGRSVRKGEHGVKVFTYVQRERKHDDGTTETSKMPFSTTVFHISQTEVR